MYRNKANSFLVILISLGLGLPALSALDLNGDGMSDVWQKDHPATIGLPAADPDGDGQTNLQESISYTHPTDSSSKLSANLQSTAGNGSSLTLAWRAQATVLYQVEQSADLITWGPGEGLQPSYSSPTTGAALSVALAAGGAGTKRFWRLRALGATPDTDGDLLNGWEETRLQSNPGLSDSDSDGIPDGKDFAYSVGPAVYSPAGTGIPSTGALAGKFVRYTTSATPVALRAYGVNYFDAFQRYLRNVDDRSFTTGFAYLQTHKIPVARVMFAGFNPVDWSLYFTNKPEFYRRMDDFVEQAERHRVGLIFSMFWSYDGIGELVDDAVSAGYLTPGTDFTAPAPLNLTVSDTPTYAEYRNELGRASSGTTALINYVTTEFVNRYRGSPAIWGWEFSNETNLAADLPNGNQFRPVANANRGYLLKRDPSTVPTYTSVDDVSRADFTYAKTNFAAKVRALDPWRFISTGDSRCRVSSWNNWQNRVFSPDSRVQMTAVMAEDNPAGISAVSVHVYPNNETYFPNDPPSINTARSTGDYAEFFSFLKGAAAAQNRPLFVGEWGVSGTGLTTGDERPTYQRMFQAIIDQEITLSLLWTFDNINPNQTATFWVNPGTDKEYQLTNTDPALWDLEQANLTYGSW
jgi:hypothetical protein